MTTRFLCHVQGMQYFGPYWSTVKFAMAIALAVPVVVFMFGLMEGEAGISAAQRNARAFYVFGASNVCHFCLLWRVRQLSTAAASRNPSNGSYGSSPGAESQTAGEQAADAAAGPHKPARPARHSISETPVILPNSALCAFCGPAILPTSPRVICILFSVGGGSGALVPRYAARPGSPPQAHCTHAWLAARMAAPGALFAAAAAS